jgi:hypothetical protein
MGAGERVESDLTLKRLRDEFAMAALQGLAWTSHSGGVDDKEIVAGCYRLADAMLAEREKENRFDLHEPVVAKRFLEQQQAVDALKTENAKLRQELVELQKKCEPYDRVRELLFNQQR